MKKFLSKISLKHKVISVFLLLLLIVIANSYFGLYDVFTESKNITIDYNDEIGSIFSLEYMDKKYKQIETVLHWSIIASIFISIIYYTNNKNTTTKKEAIILSLKIPLIPLYIIAIISYILLYVMLGVVVLGIFNHEFTNIDFWKQEIENGVLSLRVTSFMILLNLVIKVNILTRIDGWDKRRGITWFGFSTIGDNIMLKLSPDLVQLYFYMIVIYILFISSIQNSEGLAFYISITSWSLLFIIDDWKIITDYKNIFNRKILKIHSTRINTLNILLLLSTSIILYKTYSFNVSVTIICVMAISLLGAEYLLTYILKKDVLNRSILG